MHRDCAKFIAIALAKPLDFNCGKRGECAKAETDQVVQKEVKWKARLEQENAITANTDDEDTPKNTHAKNSPSAAFEEVRESEAE